MNKGVHRSFQITVFVFWEWIQEVESQSYMEALFLILFGQNLYTLFLRGQTNCEQRSLLHPPPSPPIVFNIFEMFHPR